MGKTQTATKVGKQVAKGNAKAKAKAGSAQDLLKKQGFAVVMGASGVWQVRGITRLSRQALAECTAPAASQDTGKKLTEQRLQAHDAKTTARDSVQEKVSEWLAANPNDEDGASLLKAVGPKAAMVLWKKFEQDRKSFVA